MPIAMTAQHISITLITFYSNLQTKLDKTHVYPNEGTYTIKIKAQNFVSTVEITKDILVENPIRGEIRLELHCPLQYAIMHVYLVI